MTYEYKAKLIKVVDGDTLDVQIDLGFNIFQNIRVRLLGVNTPETYGVKKESIEYKKGMKAKQFVINYFEGVDKFIVKLTKIKKESTAGF